MIVFACPVYWFTITAQLKLFMDRLYGLWVEKTHCLRGKTFAALLVFGDADPYLSGAVNAIHTFEDVARYLGARFAGVAYGSANDIGEADRNPELCDKAKSFGKALMRPAER